MSSYAVVQTGGKQYRVQPGDVIDVEKLDQEVGARVDLSSVLLVDADGDVFVGTPTVDGAKVTAEVADQFRGPKIIVYKYKAKTHYRRKNGHRQSYTRLRIRHILTGGAEEPEEVADAGASVEAAPVEEATAPAPRRRRRSTRAAAAAVPAEESAAEEAPASEEPVAEAEAVVAEEAAAEAPEAAEAATEEAPAEEAPAEVAADESSSEEASEGEEKAN